MLAKELAKAKALQRNPAFGTQRAATYMANRNWSLESALWNLCRATVRR